MSVLILRNPDANPLIFVDFWSSRLPLARDFPPRFLTKLSMPLSPLLLQEFVSFFSLSLTAPFFFCDGEWKNLPPNPPLAYDV